MAKPARGNAVQLGLRPEAAYNVPPPLGTAYEWLRPRLPVAAGLTRSEEASGQVNKSGYTPAGIPGFVTGEGLSIPVPMVAPNLLPWLQHVLGSSVANGTLTKTTLEAGPPAVYQYVFEPDPDGVDRSEEILVGFPPVANYLLRGAKFGALQIAVQGAGEIPVTLSGFVSHGTRVGPSTAEAGNTGTYVKGPHLRGPLADPSAGRIWVQKVSDGPLTFKVIQAAAAPAAGDWTAAQAQTVATDADGNAVWQIALDDGLLDLGLYTSENKDPLEIVFPGDDTDHALAVNGDTWSFDPSWSLPAATYLDTTGRRYTMAHWRSFQRALGAGVWVETPMQQMTLDLAWPVTPDQGSGTRYYTGLDRDQQLAPVIQTQRRWLDTVFLERAERHDRQELRQLWEGVQLGTGQYRESVDLVMPSVGQRSRSTDAPVGAITESLELIAETDGNGAAPITATVITDRDWTPAT